MSSAVADRIKSLGQSIALSQAEIGFIVGSSGRTLNRWATGSIDPQPLTKQRLLELVAVANALTGVFTSEGANLWLFTPNPLLDYDKPADRIKSGNCKSVLALIEALADGVVV